MFVYKVEEEVVVVVEYIKKGYGYVNYGCIFFVMYIFFEVVWVGQFEQDFKKVDIFYCVGIFFFSVNFCVKINFDIEGFVKIFVDFEIDCFFGIYIIGFNVGEMIVEGIFVFEYGVFSEDIVCICYVYFIFFEVFKEVVMVIYVKVIYF